MDFTTYRANIAGLRALDLSAYPKIDAMRVSVFNPFKSHDPEVPSPDPATWDYSKIRINVTLIMRFGLAQQAAHQGVSQIEKHIMFAGDETLASMTANVQTIAAMAQRFINGTVANSVNGPDAALDTSISAVDRGRKVIAMEND